MARDIEPLLAQAQQALETARRALAQEITSYPTPISDCDAQFNHLLAQRSQISRALDALQSDVFVPTSRTPTPFSGVESR
jgi:hypothetical protein